MTRASDTAKLLGAGATILDGTTISTADNDPQLILTSTDADGDRGPVVQFTRDSGSPADNDVLGRVQFLFDNDAAEVTTAVQIEATATDVSNGTEDSALNLVTMVDGNTRGRLKFTSSEAVFNEDSIDSDFRVESNGNANMLFVDGGNNKIGIGHNSPNTSLHIRSATASNIAGYRDGTTSLIVEGDTASYIQFVANKQAPMGLLFDGGDTHNDSARGGVTYDIDYGLAFKSGGSTRWKIDESGDIIPYSTSSGIVLGSTSNTDANTLDDYEQGTFTPAWTSSGSSFQYSTQQGIYTKIGNRVCFTIYVQLDGGGNSFSSNAVTLGGFPFTSSETMYFPVLGRFLNSDAGSGYYDPCILLNGGGTSAALRQLGDNVGGVASAANVLSSSSGQVWISGTYRTDS